MTVAFLRRSAPAMILFLLVSCGSRDAEESLIVGRWRTDAVGTSSNSVFLNLSHEENAISGHADVNGGVYDLDGRWEGSLQPEETVNLELSVVVRGLSITGTGTLNAGEEDHDVTVSGRRAGMAFDMSLSPEGGQTMKVSGQIAYDLNEFKLRTAIEGLPTNKPDAHRRKLQLTVRGTRRGGGIDLF